MASDLCRSTRYSPHRHSDSFSTAPAPLLLQAACKQLCRKLSFHLPTRSKLPDNVSSNTCIQPCTDTVERTCFVFCGSRRVSWLVGKKLDWWPPLRTTLSLTCCKSKKCATCARRKYGRPSSASLCRPCRSKSPAWTTRCSKRPLSLPDTGRLPPRWQAARAHCRTIRSRFFSRAEGNLPYARRAPAARS